MKDDPWDEMRRSADGGTVLFQRIHCWVKEIEKNILESSQSSPSTKSALRQLQQDRFWCSRTVTGKNDGWILNATLFEPCSIRPIFLQTHQTTTVIRGNWKIGNNWYSWIHIAKWINNNSRSMVAYNWCTTFKTISRWFFMFFTDYNSSNRAGETNNSFDSWLYLWDETGWT